MSLSNYGKYLFEREGAEIVEDNNGFATFKVTGDVCYIMDIYVVPEKRKFNVAGGYADQISDIAKLRGCKRLLGTVSPAAKGSTTSLKVLLGYGFTLDSSDSNMIYFFKEL